MVFPIGHFTDIYRTENLNDKCNRALITCIIDRNLYALEMSTTNGAIVQ